MKNNVKPTKVVSFLSMAAAIAVASTALAPAAGTDILHFSIKDKLVPGPDSTNTPAQLNLQYKSQGKVTVQSLDISAKKLTPNASYTLVIPAPPVAPPPPPPPPPPPTEPPVEPPVTPPAAVEPETPPPAPVPVVIATFSADKRGMANLRFSETVHQNGKQNKLPKGKLGVPSQIAPLTSVTNLAIVDATGVAILTCDLSTPEKLSYLVKRDLSTQQNRATFQMTGSAALANLRLSVFGLTPSASYKLKLNGGEPELFTANESGRLEIRIKLDQPYDTLKLTKVELLDAADVLVLMTELPM